MKTRLQSTSFPTDGFHYNSVKNSLTDLFVKPEVSVDVQMLAFAAPAGVNRLSCILMNSSLVAACCDANHQSGGWC